MTDIPPDRLSVDPASPFHDEAVLTRGVGVRIVEPYFLTPATGATAADGN